MSTTNKRSAANPNPTVSVIIPVYNSGAAAQTIIGQILAQAYADFELILVDDGSTDNSLTLLRQTAAHDQRVKVTTQPNGGPARARNTGLKLARGELIFFFDSDDQITPQLIPRMVAKINSSQADLVTCGVQLNTVKHGRRLASRDVGVTPSPPRRKTESFTNYLLRLLGQDGRLYNIYNKVYRRSIIEQHQIRFQPGLDFGEDLSFNLDYLRQSQSLAFINQPLYIYDLDLTAGTFARSSLVYTHRQTNFTHLTAFAGPAADPDLLAWIKIKWFYSFLLALANNSTLSLTEKLRRIKAARKGETFPAPVGHSLGRSQRGLIRLISASSHAPLLAYSGAKLFNFLRRVA